MNNYITRIPDIGEKLSRRSLFLFGPRQTGKSTYIRHQLADVALSWSLLDNTLFRNLLRDPSLLKDTIRDKGITEGIVVIDEIQRLPELLNEVHLLIEDTDIHFLLTGSSARKLRKQGVNLLGGRAGRIDFHPLVFPEIKDTGFTLEEVFYTGLLPSFFRKEESDELLSDYVNLYVSEEIDKEAVVRNLPSFWNFLEIAARQSGEIVNYSNVSRDIGISSVSVQEWYRILVDTLIGFEVPPYRKSVKRKPNSASKFYLFDTGVTRKLQNLSVVEEGSPDFGRYFENYIAMEIRAYLDYTGRKDSLCYWHTSVQGYEVDFIIGDKAAVEIKSSRNITSHDMKGLRAFMEEGLVGKYILVTRDDFPRLYDNGVLSLPWKEFLERMWDGRLF